MISISKSGFDLNETLSEPSDSSSDIEWLMLNLIAMLNLKYEYYSIINSTINNKIVILVFRIKNVIYIYINNIFK